MQTKRLSSLVLCVLMLIGIMTGCGQIQSDGVKQTVAPTNSSADAEPKASEELVIDNEPYEFTIYSKWGELGYLSEVYFNKLSEELNLKIKFELPAASSYNDSLQLLLASGKYPECIFIPNYTVSYFIEGCQNGIFLDVKDYLDSGKFPDIMAHTAEVSWLSIDLFKDGRIWGVPRSSPMRADGYGVRKDWLEKLGIPFTDGDTMTLDELYNMLHAITYNDPDGNNVNDTYGFYACADYYATHFSEAFGFRSATTGAGGISEGWEEIDGQYMARKFSKTDPSFKEYLTFMAKLWADGLYDPNTFSQNSTVAMERWTQGIVGLRESFPGNMSSYVINMKKVNPNADLVFISAITKTDNAPYTAVIPGTGVYGLWSITSTTEKPERILQLFNTVLDDDHWMDLSNRSVLDVGYKIEKGNVVDISSTLPEDKRGNKAISNFLRRSDGPEFFLKLDLTSEERKKYLDLIQITMDNYKPSLDAGYLPSVTSDPTFLDYNNEMNAQIARIITGELPVSAWDNILDGWYKAGGDKYISEMQEYIASTRK